MRRFYFPAAIFFALICYSYIYFLLRPGAFAAHKAFSNTDYSCFYRAGKMVLTGHGEQVYDFNSEVAFDKNVRPLAVVGHQEFQSFPFMFPPFSLLFYAPLALLPYKIGEFACYVINVLALIAVPVAFWRARLLNLSQAALWVAVTPLFSPVVWAIMEGQPVPIIALLVGLAYIALHRDLDVAAGSLLAIAAIKPQLVIVVVLTMIFAKKWRALCGFAAVGIALAIASIPLAGIRGSSSFLRALAHPLQERPDAMCSIRGLAYVVLHSHLTDGHLLVVTVMASMVLISICFLVASKMSSPAGFSVVIMVGLLASLHSYVQDATMLLIPALLVAKLPTKSFRAAGLAAVALLFSVPLLPRILGPYAFRLGYSTIPFAGLMLAISLVCRSNISVMRGNPASDPNDGSSEKLAVAI